MSVPGQVYTMKSGVNFRNVVGSSDDPQYGGMDWLELWETETGLYNYNGNCCACNTRRATLGGHIVLGDGTATGMASKKAEDLVEGNRVFLAPLCSTCNAQTRVLTAQFDVPVLNLCAFFLGERADLQEFTARFYDTESDVDDREYEACCAKIEREHERFIEAKKKEGINQYDWSILNRAPISRSGRISKLAMFSKYSCF